MNTQQKQILITQIELLEHYNDVLPPEKRVGLLATLKDSVHAFGPKPAQAVAPS